MATGSDSQKASTDGKEVECSALMQWLSDQLLQERMDLEIAHQAILREFTAQLKTLQPCAPLPSNITMEKVADAPQIATASKEEGVAGEEAQVVQKISTIMRSPRSFVHSKSFQAETPMAQFVTSERFEIIFASVIAMNMLVLALESQYDGLDLGYDLKYPHYNSTADNLWHGGEFTFSFLDWFFGFIYLFEVLLKMIVLRKDFLDLMNCFDLLVVFVWLVERFFDQFPFRAVIVRLFRIAKVLRLLRLVHEVAALDQLFLMVCALKGSLQMLFWTTILLFGTLCIFAFSLNQLIVGICINDTEELLSVRQECFAYFGTFTRSIFSMFELTLGNWIPLSRFLLEHVSEYFVIFCLVYKLTLGFAVVGVINACFIKETFKTVASNRHLMVIERLNDRKNFAKEMKSLLMHADQQGDGNLTKDEFALICLDHEVNTWLSALGLEASDSDKLFDMMDDGSGELSLEELTKGIGTLKGQARSLDLKISGSHQTSMQMMLHEIGQQVKELRSRGPSSPHANPEDVIVFGVSARRPNESPAAKTKTSTLV